MNRGRFTSGCRAGRVLRALALAAVLAGQAGCEALARAVQDGVLDFVESTTADMLEEAVPLRVRTDPAQSGEPS